MNTTRKRATIIGKTVDTIMRVKTNVPKKMNTITMKLVFAEVQVYLRAVQRPLQNPTGPLIAVARIVPDFHNYRSVPQSSHGPSVQLE